MSTEPTTLKRWNWKRLAVIALFGGIGIGLGGAICLYGVILYEERPKAWDAKSVTVSRAQARGVSSLDGVGPDAKTTGVGVMFTFDVENNSSQDITLSKEGTKVMQQNKETGALRESVLSLSEDASIPAKHKIELVLAKFDMCGVGLSEQVCFADNFGGYNQLVLMDDAKKLEVHAEIPKLALPRRNLPVEPN